MSRSAQPRTKIYRETVDRVLENHKMSKSEFCFNMGHTTGWYGVTFKRGFYDITKPSLRLWATVIGCEEDELTKVPVSNVGKTYTISTEAEELARTKVMEKNLAEMRELLTDGFKMLHTDIRNLIETMDKYWKPDPPKYQVKDVEQS